MTPKELVALTPQELEQYLRDKNIANGKEFSKKQWRLRNKGQVEYYDTKNLPFNVHL